MSSLFKFPSNPIEGKRQPGAHTKYAIAQGIRWTSRRYPPADCVLLFGDRIAESTEELVVEAPALRDLYEPGTTGFASFQAVMLEAGITPSP